MRRGQKTARRWRWLDIRPIPSTVCANLIIRKLGTYLSVVPLLARVTDDPAHIVFRRVGTSRTQLDRFLDRTMIRYAQITDFRGAGG